MMLNPNFFDYEKNLTKLLNSPSKIEVFKIPKKSRLRKKSEDTYFSYNNDLDKGKLFSTNKTKIADSVISTASMRKRCLSQNKKRDEVELIISNIDQKDDFSDIRPLTKQVQLSQRTPTLNPRSIFLLNSIKRSPNNRYRKKKIVSFKTKFVDIIEVESYKKYNKNRLLNETNEAKCTCFIY